MLVDVETTGFSPQHSEIIEVAALKIVAGKPESESQSLVRTSSDIPANICQLTGITAEMLSNDGRDLKEVLSELLEFIGECEWGGHNSRFDYNCLRESCLKCKMNCISRPNIDTLALARKKVTGVKNYKLTTLVQHFDIVVETVHRALADCYLTYELLNKLNETNG